jgi:spore coat polysaccharide biosynthesis protein SpsF
MRSEHPRVVLISQARMESTRLPGKVLRDLGGEPLLKRVWERSSQATRVDEVVIAMPDTPSNDELEAVCRSWGASVSRGALDDVLSRYARAASEFAADVVVRVTSDCPFCDPGVIDAVIELLLSDRSHDYASDNLRRSWPLGLDAEAFWSDVLARADAEATEPHEREHVTPYIYQHPERFRLANLEAPEWAQRQYRLTVDEAADLEMARAVVGQMDPADSDVASVLAFLDSHPEIASINAHVSNRDVSRPASW